MRFRLLAGSHLQTNPDGKEYTYHTGDVLEYHIDLSERWPEKFLRVDDYTPVTVRQGRSGIESTDQTATRYKVGEPKAMRQQPPPYTPPSQDNPVAQAAKSGFTGHTPHSGNPFPPEYDRLLNSMSEQELRAHAAEEEIDVSKCTDQASLVNTIKTAWT